MDFDVTGLFDSKNARAKIIEIILKIKFGM